MDVGAASSTARCGSMNRKDYGASRPKIFSDSPGGLSLRKVIGAVRVIARGVAPWRSVPEPPLCKGRWIRRKAKTEGLRWERCRGQMKRPEQGAAVDKIEDQRKPADFIGHRNPERASTPQSFCLKSAKRQLACGQPGQRL